MKHMQDRKLTKRQTIGAAFALGLSALLGFGNTGFAQENTLRMILPFSAGSGVDGIARAAGPAMSKALGKSVVMENLAGAGGVVGTQALVKAAPDGNTVAMVSNNHVVNPGVYKKLPYDTINDITPISVIGSTPFVLVVNPTKIKAKNAKELGAELKAKPESFNYASSGNGTILHLAAEMFVDQVGVKITHVPYKGVGPMVTDLLSGQVDFGVLPLLVAQGHIKSGALRVIGVSSKKRVSAAPEIPTFVEQGMPNYLVDGWFALVGPAKLPAAEVKKLHDGVVAAYKSPEMLEVMKKQGNEIDPSTPEEAAAFFKSELKIYTDLAKKAGISLD